MNFRAIIATIALLALIAAAWWQYGDQFNFSLPNLFSADYAVEEGTTVTTAENGQLVADQYDDVSALSQDFINLYQKALNNSDNDAATEARSLLSSRAHTVIDRDASVSDGLKRLTRNLEAPQDIKIDSSRVVNENFAEVKTIWTYPTERLERYFYIIIEDGSWKIDSIQSIPQ